MDHSLLGSSVHGIFQARILGGLPCAPPGHLPNPGIEPLSLMSPALAGRFLTLAPPGKPISKVMSNNFSSANHSQYHGGWWWKTILLCPCVFKLSTQVPVYFYSSALFSFPPQLPIQLTYSDFRLNTRCRNTSLQWVLHHFLHQWKVWGLKKKSVKNQQ